MTIKPDIEINEGETVVVEPRVISKTFVHSSWPQPQLTTMAGGGLTIYNNTSEIIPVHKNDHLCQIFMTKTLNCNNSNSTPIPKLIKPVSQRPFSKHVKLDPDSRLSPSIRALFEEENLKYDELFEPSIGRYNDASGKVRARVNLGKVVPPTRKLHVPQYDKNNLDLLQEKFDELERQGVFARPEDVNVVVEHVSPSFLVKKSNGSHRLVTAFTSLGQYCKTLPVSMPTVDSVLRMLGTWKYVITSDLRDAFYQIPLEHSSMKWCGTPTPYRGLRVYLVAAQGMPGSSESLEEMLCTVLGEFVKEGWVAKIADDLSVGASTIEELLENWSKVMNALFINGLKLKADKTFIIPLCIQILGWDWHDGHISASKHKIAALIACEPPKTVTAMRSFIGAYKTFNRVVKQCTSHVSALEELISGRQKRDGIVWTDEALRIFNSAKKALENTPSICLPRPDDELMIVHDGCNGGIGSILFVKREDRLSLGQYFSAKLKSHHQKWLPCEIEALSIAASINHFAPLIRESKNITQILTDSRPCVQSWCKLLRGEFSTSARVATFLSTISEFNVELQHLKGDLNMPSDFQSRNPPTCTSGVCQICKFVSETSDSVVRKVCVDDILSGRAQAPYSNRMAWKDIQLNCTDLKRVHAHLSSGTRPTSKSRMTNVKRYLQKVVIGKDGLLVVLQSEPFLPRRELIVVPQNVILGFMTSLHLRLNHPTEHQLHLVFQRNFFALKSQHFAKVTLQNCDLCQSLKVVPKELHIQSSSDVPLTPCRSFAADIVRRFLQKIYVLRDTFSSFLIAELITSEDAPALREILCKSISFLRPSPQVSAVVRTDNASGFVALKDDHVLKSLNISIDLGRRHNKNKNPVADKGIQELISELLRLNPEGGQTNSIELAQAVNQLNSRIRGRGLSAWEILTQRDSNSGVVLDIDDNVLSDMQTNTRINNQVSSARNKSRGGGLAEPAHVAVGSLVFIKDDASKLKARDRYLVVEKEGSWCTLKKLLKSNLRDKTYKLKTTEVYPVSSNVIHNESYLRGYDCDDDDEEETCEKDEMMPVVDVVDTSAATSEPSVREAIPIGDGGQFDYMNAVPGEDSSTTDNHSLIPADTVGDDSALQQADVDAPLEPPPSRRSTRSRRQPSWMKDFVVDGAGEV